MGNDDDGCCDRSGSLICLEALCTNLDSEVDTDGWAGSSAFRVTLGEGFFSRFVFLFRVAVEEEGGGFFVDDDCCAFARAAAINSVTADDVVFAVVVVCCSGRFFMEEGRF